MAAKRSSTELFADESEVLEALLRACGDIYCMAFCCVIGCLRYRVNLNHCPQAEHRTANIEHPTAKYFSFDVRCSMLMLDVRP
jgi:hypothetical protein